MRIEITLSDEVIAAIDAITSDRSDFVAAAVTRALREAGRNSPSRDEDETPRFSTIT
jgi:Arc/MetJ family transcription regulator